MKEIIWSCLVLLCLLLAVAGCTGEKIRGDFGGSPVSLMPEYIGEPLANDPNHTFTKEEFKVTVIFSDSSTREVTDYKLTQTREEGCYEIVVTWNGLEGERLIPMTYDPSADLDYKDPADHETIPETLPSAETDLSTVSAEEEPAA